VYCISRLRFSNIGGMVEVDEQRVCIKFYVRLGKTGSETFEMLKQAFGDSCMSRSRTFEWFGRFKNGRTSTANDDRSGRPNTTTTPSKVEQVREAVNQDRRRTIYDLCAEVGIGYGSSHRTAEHASDCSEVCTESVDSGSERQSSSDLSGTEGNCDKRSDTPLERHHRR